MLIFNKLRTQQALGGLEISNGSGGGSCCGGGGSLELYLGEGGGRWLQYSTCYPGTRSEEEVRGKAGRQPGQLGPNGQAGAVGCGVM